MGEAGRLRFRPFEQGETFLNGSAFGPGAWLVLLPDGRFDGTPGALRYLCYTEQGTFNSFTAEELQKEFYDPKAVQEVVQIRPVKSEIRSPKPASRRGAFVSDFGFRVSDFLSFAAAASRQSAANVLTAYGRLGLCDGQRSQRAAFSRKPLRRNDSYHSNCRSTSAMKSSVLRTLMAQSRVRAPAPVPGWRRSPFLSAGSRVCQPLPATRPPIPP